MLLTSGSKKTTTKKDGMDIFKSVVKKKIKKNTPMGAPDVQKMRKEIKEKMSKFKRGL